MKSFDLLVSVILSLGALQGIIYGIILWRGSSVNPTANRILASILFFFSYRLLVEVLKLQGFGYYDWLYHILLEYNWIYGALIFLFVKALVTPAYKFQFKEEWRHFIPVGIEFVWSNFIKTQNFFWDGTRESLSWFGYWGYVVWMHYPTQFVVTTALVIYYTIKANRLISTVTRETDYIVPNSLKWIDRVITVMKYFSISVLVIVMADFLFLDYAFTKIYEYPIFIGMAGITYWLGLDGFSEKNTVVIKPNAILTEKDRGQINDIATLLSDKMKTEQLYKNPNLSLNCLADSLGIKSYMLSKCLNHHFHTKFNDYINAFRIEEVKSLLADPKNRDYTLLSLAFEAGFNSKASFNRAVKKLTGESPKALKP